MFDKIGKELRLPCLHQVDLLRPFPDNLRPYHEKRISIIRYEDGAQKAFNRITFYNFLACSVSEGRVATVPRGPGASCPACAVEPRPSPRTHIPARLTISTNKSTHQPRHPPVSCQPTAATAHPRAIHTAFLSHSTAWILNAPDPYFLVILLTTWILSNPLCYFLVILVSNPSQSR